MKNLETLKNNGVDVTTALSFWGDEESYQDALNEYNNNLQTNLSNLKNYFANHDFNSYGILAHSLKSEAKYLGFMKQADTFLAHEMAGKESNQTFITQNMSTLETTISELQKIINDYLHPLKKSIIVSDDSSIILKFISQNINEQYEVITTSNGQEAINALNPDIYALFLDINMPKVDGFKVLEYMQENNLFDNIPVIIITGDDTKDTIKKAFNYPILDILNKPFSSENILSLLNNIENFHHKTS